jgi:hypothetical protein
MDTDPAIASFESQSAAIAADIAAKFDGSPSPAPAAVVAEVPAAVAPPVAESSAPPGNDVVAKLLTKLTDMEAQIAALKGGAPAAVEPTQPAGNQNLDSWEDFHEDPWTAMERRGIDPQHVARAMVAKAMGNDAPQDLRAEVRTGAKLAQTNQQIAQLTAQVQSLTKELGRRDYYSELNSYTPAADSTPATAEMLKANPTWVKEQVKAVVQEDAYARAKVPGAKPLTPAEVYQRLEARIAPVYSALRPPQPASVTPSQAAAPQTPTAAQTVPLASSLGGAPPAAPAPSTWEDKVNAIMKDVLSKHGLSS